MTLPRRPLTALTLTAALGLAAAGCGSSDDGGGDSTSTPAAAPAASTPAAASSSASGGSGEVKIAMKNIAFAPDDVTVKVGQTITWTDEEPVEHNVVAQSGAKFESDIFGEGKSYSFTPKSPGVIKYECTLHPGMDGTITVQ